MVDDVEISQQSVEDLVAASKRFYTQAEELGLDEAGTYAAQLEAFDGAGEDTVSRSEVSSALFSLVRAELIRAELAREDALPTEEDRAAARANLEQQLTKEVVDQIDEEFLDFSIESQVYVQAYQTLLAEQLDAEQEPLDPAEVEAQRQQLYEELAPTQPICLNLIQVATEAEAQAGRDRLDDGESFGALAAELSLQETTEEDGGFFACGTAEQVQQSFGIDVSAASVGDVFGPVEFRPKTAAPRRGPCSRSSRSTGPPTSSSCRSSSRRSRRRSFPPTRRSWTRPRPSISWPPMPRSTSIPSSAPGTTPPEPSRRRW